MPSPSLPEAITAWFTNAWVTCSGTFDTVFGVVVGVVAAIVVAVVDATVVVVAVVLAVVVAIVVAVVAGTVEAVVVATVVVVAAVVAVSGIVGVVGLGVVSGIVEVVVVVEDVVVTASVVVGAVAVVGVSLVGGVVVGVAVGVAVVGVGASLVGVGAGSLGVTNTWTAGTVGGGPAGDPHSHASGRRRRSAEVKPAQVAASIAKRDDGSFLPHFAKTGSAPLSALTATGLIVDAGTSVVAGAFDGAGTSGRSASSEGTAVLAGVVRPVDLPFVADFFGLVAACPAPWRNAAGTAPRRARLHPVTVTSFAFRFDASCMRVFRVGKCVGDVRRTS
jgi:hypothetical protein